MTAAEVQPSIRTARLTLRPRRMADAARFAAHLAERDVVWMLSSMPHPYTRADAEEWLSGALDEPGDLPFVIDDGTGALGVIALNTQEGDTRRLGFWLAKPFWGKGLTGEAAKALVGWGFAQTAMDRLVSRVFVENTASRRIHDRLGFRETGPTTMHSPVRGGSGPAVGYELTRRAWEGRT